MRIHRQSRRGETRNKTFRDKSHSLFFFFRHCSASWIQIACVSQSKQNAVGRVARSENRLLIVKKAKKQNKKKQLKDDSVVNAGQQNTAKVKSEVKGAVMWHVCVVFLKIDKKKKCTKQQLFV